jgi:hypothetical protein
MRKKYMKINWKILVASVVIVVAIFWAASSVRSSSYSGTNLDFAIGSGALTLTNPSNTPVDSQFVSTGSRSFTVSSNIEGVSGSSTRQSSGSKVTQLFEFSLPPGVSVLTVTRGTGVSFAGNTTTSLKATMEPLSQGEASTTIGVALIVVVVALFYISRSTGHRWISMLRPKQVAEPVIASLTETPSDEPTNRGRDGRMYSNYGAKD